MGGRPGRAEMNDICEDHQRGCEMHLIVEIDIIDVLFVCAPCLFLGLSCWGEGELIGRAPAVPAEALTFNPWHCHVMYGTPCIPCSWKDPCLKS